jgi:Polyketide cyclase / dehydrase and lipid transport
VRRASARTTVPLTPPDVLRLWADVERWPSFVEGFARRLELREPWPEPGGRVVWESTPDGRGRVTETVSEREADRFATQVYEDALAGTQTLRAVPASDGGSEVELSLEYQLSKYGPLRGLADAIFIRRALRDALRRTLYRFGLEAEEEARLT